MRPALVVAVLAFAGLAACNQDVTPESGAPVGATVQPAPDSSTPTADEEKKPN